LDIYTPKERENRKNRLDILTQDYSFLTLSQCFHVPAPCIEGSLINKRYYILLNNCICDRNKYFLWKNIICDAFFNILRSLFNDLKLREFVEEVKYNSSELFISFDKSIYHISSHHTQAPWIWVWIQYLFTVYIHYTSADSKFDVFLNELSEMLKVKEKDIRLPALLYFLCKYLFSILKNNGFRN
jgi:hypothetical protein